jgi:succinoglycan biosynthesis transport protein ExoP
MQNVIQLKEQLRTLEYERDQLREKYTESYVEVQEKNSAIAALRKRVNDEIVEIINVLSASVQALLHEERTLRSNSDAIRGQIRGLSGKELEMAKLSRGISETEELYSLLLKQREEAKLSQSKSEMVVRVKIISAATVPLRPLPTNRVAKLIIVLCLGVFAGVSLAFFLDFFDHSFKNAEDVQRFLNLDILASIRSFDKP